MSILLGKKISLISKACIRYEGILYTIDPTESTVALSKVKSFGTEERPAERFIPPRDEVYEYIIFRGTDIRDVHVCESSLYSEDSAIVKIMCPSTFINPSPLNEVSPQHVDVSASDTQLHNHDSSPSGFNTKINQKDRNIKNSPSFNKSSDHDSSNFFDIKVPKKQVNLDNSESDQLKSDNFDMDKIATNDFHNFMNRDHYKYEGSNNDEDREYGYRRGNNQRQRGFKHSESRRGSQFTTSGNGIPSNWSYRINREVTIEPIKDDFDFETSNAILEKELANINVSNDENRSKAISDIKDSSDVTVSDYGDEKHYYDKTKSFFDCISSEMSERTISDKRNERRSNTETFGDSNYNRGGRGNRWGNRRGQFRGNYNRASSAGFLRRGNYFNRGGESRGRGQVGGSSNNKRLIAVGGNRGSGNEN